MARVLEEVGADLMHTTSHALAGKTVRLNDSALDDPRGIVVPGAEYAIEDWWDLLTGGSWMYADGNPAALQYAIRVVAGGLPIDDQVVYGKIGSFGHLVHVSELGPVVVPA